MKKRFNRYIGVLLVLTMLAGVAAFSAPQPASKMASRGRVVVANRGSGSISVIDAKTDALIGTYPLPSGDLAPEPMYVVYTPANNRVFVGDRANDRVVVFNARDFSVEATVAAGAGVFHMWADPQNQQLWVNNDIDNTSTVLDPQTLETLATVPTPADLVAMGGKPHDVILDPTGDSAYVTVLGLSGDHDYVVKFSTKTFSEVGRAPVGKDPHVSLARQNDFLYVPSQNSNVVIVLDRETLALVTEIPVPGAHGAGMTRNGKVFYTTNLPGGGTDGLFAIDTRTNTVIGEPVDTPYAVPHNIALTNNGKKLFLTHSGPTADKVTIYTSSGNDPIPVLSGEVTVGLNPFGLTFIP
jgi:DNA-binding beta-propeller fold protein YncE